MVVYGNARDRPIALLNTLGKALERLIAIRLKETSEENNLLPKTQLRARPNRSTETALYLLKERILAILALGKIPSLLALDVQKTYDNISYLRLIHNLRKRKVPNRIIG